MSALEIFRFEDDGGGFVDSWYAEGHQDEEVFIEALVADQLERGDDIPPIPVGSVVHQYMRKVPTWEGRWNAQFESESKRGAQPVTTFDMPSRPFGGASCQVDKCTQSVQVGQCVPAVLEPGDGVDRPLINLALCREHWRMFPSPSYRVFMVPVGATIVLEKAADE